LEAFGTFEFDPAYDYQAGRRRRPTSVLVDTPVWWLALRREEERCRKLRNFLHAMDEPRREVSDYEDAAQMHNRCRTRAMAGSTIELLICSIAYGRNRQIFTTDRDFRRYVPGVKLHVAVV